MEQHLPMNTTNIRVGQSFTMVHELSDPETTCTVWDMKKEKPASNYESRVGGERCVFIFWKQGWYRITMLNNDETLFHTEDAIVLA